jgi:hypothetical protein
VASFNPITCRACNAQFAVPDELFRRRLSGRKVIVRCRNCGAHITVDATDSVPPVQAEPPTAVETPLVSAASEGGPKKELASESALAKSAASEGGPKKELASKGGPAKIAASEGAAERSPESKAVVETSTASAGTTLMNKPLAEPRQAEPPAGLGARQPLHARGVKAPGVVPRLSGQKSKLPPVVPRAFAAPHATRTPLGACAKSKDTSSEADGAVVVKAVKPTSVSRAVAKRLPGKAGSATAAKTSAPEAPAPKPQSTSNSSTRLVAAVPRPAAPAQPARPQAAALPAATPTAQPVSASLGSEAIAATDDAERSTAPLFDSEEAPTHPLGAELGDPHLSARGVAAASPEPTLADAAAGVSAQDTGVGETTPGSAAHRIDQSESGANAADEDAPKQPAGGTEPAPMPLGSATAADTPASASADISAALPPRSPTRRRTRWAIASTTLAAVVVSAAVFAWSQTHQALGSASLVRHSRSNLPAPFGASSASQRPSEAVSVPAAPQKTASVAWAALAPTASEQNAAPQTAARAPNGSTPESASDDMPEGVNRELVMQRVSAVLARAERCHLGGRATGKAMVILTFEGKGRVSDARIEGEPIASAPVAACILAHARSIIIPKFSGPSFTLSHSITLR